MSLCAFIKSKILFAAAHCLDDINEPEDEILYGTAGYLQVLLLISSAMKEHAQPVLSVEPDAVPIWTEYEERISSIISRVTLKLVAQTQVTKRDDGKDIMQVLFPRFRKRGQTHYIGGAHGTLGVLYMVA